MNRFLTLLLLLISAVAGHAAGPTLENFDQTHFRTNAPAPGIIRTRLSSSNFNQSGDTWTITNVSGATGATFWTNDLGTLHPIDQVLQPQVDKGWFVSPNTSALWGGDIGDNALVQYRDVSEGDPPSGGMAIYAQQEPGAAIGTFDLAVSTNSTTLLVGWNDGPSAGRGISLLTSSEESQFDMSDLNGTSRVLFQPTETSDTSESIAHFLDTETPWTQGTLFGVRNAGTNMFTVAAVSGYTGTGTLFLTDNGTYQAVGAAEFTINPTDTYIPYRVNATQFGDSPLLRIDGDTVGFTATNTIGRVGSSIVITNGATTNAFTLRNGLGTGFHMTYNTGGNPRLDSDNGFIWFGDTTVFEGNLIPDSANTRSLGTMAAGGSFADSVFFGSHYLLGSNDAGANYSRLKIDHDNTNAVFDSQSLGTGVARDFLFQSNGVTVAKVALNSGYTGGGTLFLSDDGTFKSAGGGGGGSTLWANASGVIKPLGGQVTNALLFTSGSVDNATNSILTLDTVNAWTNIEAKFLQGRNQGTNTMFITKSGALEIGRSVEEWWLPDDTESIVSVHDISKGESDYNVFHMAALDHIASVTNFASHTLTLVTGYTPEGTSPGAIATWKATTNLVDSTFQVFLQPENHVARLELVNRNTRAFYVDDISGYTGTGTLFLSDDGSYKAAGGGGTAGTVINTGASTVGAVPRYTDLTGTNVAPSTTFSLGTSTNATLTGNLLANGGVFTNGITAGAGGDDTAFTLSPDPVRVTTTPVAVFQPVVGQSAMVLDLMPTGDIGTQTNILGTGACWIDLVNEDLRTSSTPNDWNVARINISTNGNVQMGAFSFGTNVPGALSLMAGPTFSLNRTTAGGSVAQIWASGNSTAWFQSSHFRFNGDNTFDIGADGATRPRDIFVADDVLAGGTISSDTMVATNGITAGASTFTGDVGFPDGTQASPSIYWTADADGSGTGFYRHAANRIGVCVQGTADILIAANLLVLKSAETFGWAAGSVSTTPDTILARDGAANTLALRNGANAQSFHIYNTFTDASNYERLLLGWSANRAFIGTAAAGTGTATREVVLSSAGNVVFRTSGVADRWKINSSGHFLAETDNTYDIGAAAATRPRNIHQGGYLLGTQLVSAKTADYPVVAADSKTVFTNEGTTAILNNTLPGAAAGLTYTFIVQDTDGLTVTAAAGDTIRIAASVSAAAGNITTTTVGNTVTIVAINATEWIATSVVGTWTVN